MSNDDEPRPEGGAVAASQAAGVEPVADATETWTPPASEASVVEDPAPVRDEPVLDEPLAGERPVAEAPVADKTPTFEVAAPATAQDDTGSGSGSDLAAKVDEKPELLVGAAFAGGLLAALILKRLG